MAVVQCRRNAVRVPRLRGSAGHVVQIFDLLALLLQFHTAVLEPDFDLSLGEAQRVRDLYSSFSGQVVVELKLLFKLESLVAAVRLAASPSL